MTGKTKKPQVAAIGEIVSDILPDSRKLGGAPADFLHYAVKSGADGHLISAIGADDLGREVVAELNKFGIKPVLAITPILPGGSLSSGVRAAGIRPIFWKMRRGTIFRIRKRQKPASKTPMPSFSALWLFEKPIPAIRFWT